MVIKAFTYILLIVAIGVYFIPIDKVDSNLDEKDIPLVTFNDSTMYTLNEQTTTKIVNSKKVSRYKTKDIMYEGDFILKANDKKVENATDYISANVIIKKNEDFTFLDDVKFRRNDFISLDTQELYYNEKTQIAKNSVPFKGTYYNHKIDGKNLYLDMKKEIIKAKNSHFEIETTK
ncbi:LPS export ABC transporter periplasmic protein LptC [Malaciobacter marinus]|jgi:hypothetical protein|uniref:Lipopolysaccharide-assembly LptC-related protein n=1 Tax=Malaciobacter marinus TaxID=505249 RepID=A0AB36ZYD6_9BACT|nr:LPS export ABC transporter periplasmic protein LptC [Malaciobacter marinus]PPK62980.1 lipopolysaccharide-assembly LptC-related protein [Malaciobacter marinus]